MCINCDQADVESSPMGSEVKECGCAKEVYVPKTRYSIEVEASGNMLENALRLPEILSQLLKVEGVVVKGYHVNQW